MAFDPIYKKNQLILGNPESNTGIVTLWTLKSRVAEKLDQSKYACIGQLYSATRGLDFLVRNLLANPQIRHLLVTGVDLSKSGVVLKDLFENGVRENKSFSQSRWQVVSQYEGYIDGEVDKKAIDLLRHEVKLNFFDYKQSQGLVNQIDQISTPYSESLVFEKKEMEQLYYPGEEAVYVIHGKTVVEVWLRILDTILKFGKVSGTHYDSQQKEILNLISVVSDEDPDNLFLTNFLPVSEDYLEDYFPRVLSGKEFPETSYTYGQRLRTYFGIDQIEAVIKKLSRELISRSAVASLWDPVKDNIKGGSPCLNHIWARIVNDKLYLTAIIRSNDMYAAWPENAFALRKLQELIRLGVSKNISKDLSLGNLIIISQSAHIYDDCWQEAERVVKEFLKVPVIEKDPRGSFVINVEDDQIKLEHIMPNTGESLRTFKGVDARYLQREIIKQNIISLPDHAIYLGRELQKAELALKYPNIFKYEQDKELIKK